MTEYWDAVDGVGGTLSIGSPLFSALSLLLMCEWLLRENDQVQDGTQHTYYDFLSLRCAGGVCRHDGECGNAPSSPELLLCSTERSVC